MSDLEKLASLRVDRATDNKDVKPLDLLRAMAHDIETGKIQCDGLMLLYVNRPADAGWDHGNYRCGVTRYDQLAILTLMTEQTIRIWREG